MNDDKFMTHWRGIPLKNLNRDECIDALQEIYRQHQTLNRAYTDLLVKTGKADISMYY